MFEAKNIKTAAQVAQATKDQQAHHIIEQRKTAYKNESDPLYMEWQFDQTPESENAWRAKVREIKASYPLAI
jgi:hypothetical protein